MPESLQIDSPGCHFLNFLSQCQKVFKSMLMDIISSTSGARPECLQIDAPGHHFVDSWSQGQNVFKSMLLDIIWLTSGANARKSSNQCSWTFLEPRPECLQIDAPGHQRNATPVHTKWPAVGEASEVSGSPECTKYCACASKITQRTLNAQFAKTPELNEALRLCMKNGPRSEKGWK